MRSLALFILLVPAAARAEDEPAKTDEPPATPPAASGAPVSSGERVTMPAKRGMLNAQLGINLSTDLVGKPISLSPDIWYGVNDKLTIGLVHTFVGATGIMGIPGTSLCLTGADNGCGDFYNFAGIDARYTLKSDAKLQIALDAGLFMTALDPFQLALKVGITGRYRASKSVALEFSPNIFFGITERDGELMAGGNKEVVAVPVNIVFSLNDKLALLAQLALLMPFENAGDLYALGLSLGGNYAISKQLSLSLAFSLPFLVTGFEDAGGVDARTLTLGGGYAF